MKQFSIGTSGHESIVLSVNRYEREPSGEFFDDNWLCCTVAVRAGELGGEFQASLLTAELEELRQGLMQLYDTLQGECVFEPMEKQLVLRVACDRLGAIRVTGAATPQPGSGNSLSFDLAMDQTCLKRAFDDLSDVMQAFPVRE